MTAESQQPIAIRVAASLWVVAAAIGVFFTVFLWLQRNTLFAVLRDRFALPPEQAESQLQSLLNLRLAETLLFGLCYLVGAFALYRGKKWVRIALSIVGGLHGGISLLALVRVGVSPEVVLLPVIIAALIAMWATTSSRWLVDMQNEAG